MKKWISKACINSEEITYRKLSGSIHFELSRFYLMSLSSYINDHIRAQTQPTKVIPKNKFTKNIANVFFLFLIKAIKVGKK